jgi:hypothetical protein
MTTAVVNAENLAEVDIKASIRDAIENHKANNQSGAELNELPAAQDPVLEAAKAVEDMIASEGALDVSVFVQAFNRLDLLVTRGHNEAAHRRLQCAVAFIDRVESDEVMRQQFHSERRLRLVKPAQKNGNPYPPYIRTLFGWFRPDLPKVKTDDGVEVDAWEVNPSTLSWAGVISELKRLEVPTEDIARFIGEFKFEKASGIKALEQSFTAANKGKRKKPIKVTKWKDGNKSEILKSKGLCSIELPPAVLTKLCWVDGIACDVTLINDGGKVTLLFDRKTEANQLVKAVQERKSEW